mmetsp:Transcript_18454/g.51294  ORF Transcript_18454/g.51294 Transcript_18454/m.51294 type:complete len:128 (+) Transcript_18454:245-628(+)
MRMLSTSLIICKEINSHIHPSIHSSFLPSFLPINPLIYLKTPTPTPFHPPPTSDSLSRSSVARAQQHPTLSRLPAVYFFPYESFKLSFVVNWNPFNCPNATVACASVSNSTNANPARGMRTSLNPPY